MFKSLKIQLSVITILKNIQVKQKIQTNFKGECWHAYIAVREKLRVAEKAKIVKHKFSQLQVIACSSQQTV